MKAIKLLLVAFCAIVSTAVFAQKATTETFKVNGVCGSCKKNIEKAAHVPGVAKADWNKSTKVLSLTYDPARVSSDKVLQSVAAAGYDSEKYRASDKSYKALDECCQYDRKPKL